MYACIHPGQASYGLLAPVQPSLAEAVSHHHRFSHVEWPGLYGACI